MRYSAKRISSCHRNDGEKDISDDALCVVFGISFALLLLSVPIIETPLGIDQQIHMNSEPSSSTVRSSLEIAHRLHTVGSYEYRRKDVRQFGLEIHRLSSVPVEVGSQDALHILGPKCSFFFIVLPPVNYNGCVALSNFRGNNFRFKRHKCRVYRKM